LLFPPEKQQSEESNREEIEKLPLSENEKPGARELEKDKLSTPDTSFNFGWNVVEEETETQTFIEHQKNALLADEIFRHHSKNDDLEKEQSSQLSPLMAQKEQSCPQNTFFSVLSADSRQQDGTPPKNCPSQLKNSDFLLSEASQTATDSRHQKTPPDSSRERARQAQILRLFEAAPALLISKMKVELGESIPALRRSLKKLMQAGVIRMEIRGDREFYLLCEQRTNRKRE
jgi:hypothetical protein